MKIDFLNTETVFDYKGDPVGKTGIQNGKCVVQILDENFERPIQCSLIGNLSEDRLFLTKSTPEGKPYLLRMFLQIMKINGDVILKFDKNIPIMTSIIPSISVAFSANGCVLFWGVNKKSKGQFVESMKIIDKNGSIVSCVEIMTDQRNYFYPKVAINIAGCFLICYTQTLSGSPNREWIFKFYDLSGEIKWEHIYRGYFVRDVAINQKGDLVFIVDNENFRINKQELIIIENEGQKTEMKSLSKIYTNIYYKTEGVVNLRRRLIAEKDHNIEIDLVNKY